MPATIQQDTAEARRLGERLGDQLLGGELALPLLPEAALRVVEAARSEQSDARRVAAIVQCDPSLASHVLRIANSAAYSPRVPIVSLNQAVSRLGMDALTSISLSVAQRRDLFVPPGR